MLADAFAAERYKLWRNHSALFFGFLFAPLMALLFNVALVTYLHLRNSGIPSAARIDLGDQMLRSMALGGSSFVQIFFVAGAASIFAGEYRWETWRLLTVRNSRLNLMAAKFLVYGLFAGLSLIALACVALLSSLCDAALNGTGLGLTMGDLLAKWLCVFLATWAELIVLGAVTALAAVACRATTGALMAGIFFSFGQSIAMALAHPWEAPLSTFAALPSMSAYLLRAWASGQQLAPGVIADPDKILPAALFLLAWIAALAGATAILFQSQDLSRE